MTNPVKRKRKYRFKFVNCSPSVCHNSKYPLGVLAQNTGYVYFDPEEPPRFVGHQIKDIIFYRSVFFDDKSKSVPFNKLVGSNLIFTNSFSASDQQIVKPITILSKTKCRELMPILTLFCKAYVDFSTVTFSETTKNNMYTYFSIHPKKFSKVINVKRDTYETFV